MTVMYTEEPEVSILAIYITIDYTEEPEVSILAIYITIDYKSLNEKLRH
jgi:hypothetical protein